jgi:hypothetical protein
MASAGNTAATSLELPGAYPLGYTALDPSHSDKVTAYYYSISTGLSGAPSWSEQYEPFKRLIIYDASKDPGSLFLQTRTSTGAWEKPLLLSPDVAPNGFSLTRVGNTLQMQITLRSETRAQEEVIYTAQAQTLFLRSTLNASSGSSAVTFVDNPEDADGNVFGTTTTGPSIMFGNLVTELTTVPPQQQVSLFITAPIGQQVNPDTIKVIFGNADNSVYAVVNEAQTVTVGAATVTRTTHPPADQWPSSNGTYSVTLTGSIPSTATISAGAVTMGGVATTEAKRYR